MANCINCEHSDKEHYLHYCGYRSICIVLGCPCFKFVEVVSATPGAVVEPKEEKKGESWRKGYQQGYADGFKEATLTKEEFHAETPESYAGE